MHRKKENITFTQVRDIPFRVVNMLKNREVVFSIDQQMVSLVN